jgi:enoyl-CoA hydratase/carnithine racemase
LTSISSAENNVSVLNPASTLMHRGLERAADRFGDRDAVRMGDERWSFGDLDGLANAFARHLVALGVGSGDRVAQPRRRPHPGVADLMRNDMTYDLPDALQVEMDGPVRVIRLNRPEQLNATNHELHAGLAALFPQLDADRDARAAVITGNGRAFSAGGDFGYIDELANDAELRHESLTHGRQIVTGMVACRVPIVAAVNGPAVGLGCSIVALSDIVYMAESAHLADPHVMVGLVAADGGPITWPLLTSLQLAKEYALTGDKIPAPRAAQIGLVNHVCPDDEVVDQAMACARRIAALPQRATEDTKRILNMHLERAVLATLDFALTAEDRSFTSPELRANIDRLRSRDT